MNQIQFEEKLIKDFVRTVLRDHTIPSASLCDGIARLLERVQVYRVTYNYSLHEAAVKGELDLLHDDARAYVALAQEQVKKCSIREVFDPRGALDVPLDSIKDMETLYNPGCVEVRLTTLMITR